MKRISLALLLVSSFIFNGCLKTSQPCKDKTPQQEEAEILAFAGSNGINATKHASGLYYEILDPGTGPAPTLTSVIKATYVGKLTNGQVFDQLATPPDPGWTLGGLIPGWQIGLPLIGKGGAIRLIIPSSLAYGCRGVSGGIPGNSILYFEIELVDVQ